MTVTPRDSEVSNNSIDVSSWESSTRHYERVRKPGDAHTCYESTWGAGSQVIYMTGWAPHSSQQRAAGRGSANAGFDELAKAFSQTLPQDGPS
jgi:hypothetical protein